MSASNQEVIADQLWGCADEVHLGKYIRAKDFGLECLRDVQRL